MNKVNIRFPIPKYYHLSCKIQALALLRLVLSVLSRLEPRCYTIDDNMATGSVEVNNNRNIIFFMVRIYTECQIRLLFGTNNLNLLVPRDLDPYQNILPYRFPPLLPSI